MLVRDEAVEAEAKVSAEPGPARVVAIEGALLDRLREELLAKILGVLG